MKLRTEIERMSLRQPLGCREGILLLGSCFTDHIGSWLSDAWLPVLCNPWGVLFNPASIALSLSRCLSTAQSTSFELHEHDGRYYSFSHHGQWSDADAEALQIALQQLENKVRNFWTSAHHVVVTWGTSWVYEREGEVVANCHKFPASDFVRRRLSVEEIVSLWSPVLKACDKHFIFTVSPIRHVKDTLHGNQLSKATLLLAIDRLQQLYPGQVEYLPVYELLLDDLRDYRFYAEDLVHPSALAIEAVRELVTDCAMTSELKQYIREAAPIVKALQHRPSSPESEQYRQFLNDTLQRKDALLAKYCIPSTDFTS